jgi:hypothetical protein
LAVCERFNQSIHCVRSNSAKGRSHLSTYGLGSSVLQASTGAD